VLRDGEGGREPDGAGGAGVKRIVVTGYMVRHPVAGNVLAFFQYLVGLRRLGYEVVYLEESGWPYSCYDPETHHWVDHPTAGLRLVRALVSEHAPGVQVLYVNRGSGEVDGATWDEVKRVLSGADLLLNIGGVCWLPEFLLCRRRALIDMDPLFTQVDRFGAEVLADYHTHFSYGSNIGSPGCTIPTRGVDWLPLAPPVVLDFWDLPRPAPSAPFTTIGNWGAYGGITYEGEHYGQKDEEFLRMLDLPSRTSARLELAMSGVPEEIATRIRAAGWLLRDAGEEVSVDLPSYRAYISNSRGEFSAAKNAYVKSRSGWFSDRSACYLAAGRPVILQDTGFTERLPAGRGLLGFSTIDDAVECLERVMTDYEAHRTAAREIAERVFSHEVVLPPLLDAALGEHHVGSAA
jgi:hypothetical protein